jgi:hypothetical protein
LYGDEYSWDTKYNQVSGEIGPNSPTTLAVEYMRGRSGMGVPTKAHVQVDFDAWYALVTHKVARNRFTARIEQFAVIDRAHASEDVYDDHGRAWTLAWLYDVTPKMRAGLEFVQITGRRDGSYDARKVSLELRYALR